MDEYKYCIACLVKNVTLYSIKTKIFNKTVAEILKHIFAVDELTDGKYVCYECISITMKLEEFRQKCMRAQNMLREIKKDQTKITEKKRKLNNLISKLSISQTNVYSTELTKDPGYIEQKNIQIKNEQPVNEFEEQFDQHSNIELDEENEPNFKIGTQTTKKKNKLEDLSDDEPLAKVKLKNKMVIRNKRKINLNYFDDYATVVFLTPEEAKKELLLRKESSNYINSPMKCEFCYRGYEARGAFENHMKKHRVEYGKYICDICQLRFPEQRYLCKHRLASHKRKFCCKICPYVCFCMHQAKTHVSLHKGMKYPCKECGEVFSMPNSLLMHKRQKHMTECVCEFCGNTFATPRGLYSHNMKVHRNDKNKMLGPNCEDCKIKFATDEAWKRHFVLSSKHSVSNGCKCCGDTFRSKDELKIHMRVHTRKHPRREIFKLPATCSVCNKWLIDRNEYKSHMSTTHPLSDVAKKLIAEDQTPFVCEVCGQMFKKQCFLTYHQRKHTGERPYKCATCNKTFSLAAALATHTHLHGNRKHTCNICSRVFTFKSVLNKHMKVHLGIRPHRCDICDKSFINPCDVKIHIKYVHNKVPWPKRERNKRQE